MLSLLDLVESYSQNRWPSSSLSEDHAKVVVEAPEAEMNCDLDPAWLDRFDPYSLANISEASKRIVRLIESIDYACIKAELLQLLSSIDRLAKDTRRSCPELSDLSRSFHAYVKEQQLHLINVGFVLLPACRRFSSGMQPTAASYRELSDILKILQTTNSQTSREYAQLTEMINKILLRGPEEFTYQCWLAALQAVHSKLATHRQVENDLLHCLVRACRS